MNLESTVLSSPVHDVAADPSDFQQFATIAGWGDGLPLVPPTADRVTRFLDAVHAAPSDIVVDQLPPSGAACTMEKLAINAVMAGAPAESMPLLVAALRAMSEPDFELHSLNATTGSVVPLLLVNGPVRRHLDVPCETGCLGGVAGPAPAIGRALRLVMRNVAGQQIGVTSQSVFGQPGRVAGIVFGEWEERSPWASLAERRGHSGSAVTVFGAMGTMNVCDVLAETGTELLSIIGRSMAVPGANGFLTSSAYSEALVVINPTWAEVIAREVPDIEEVQQQLWSHASTPIDDWPKRYHAPMEALGRIREGRVHLLQEPGQALVTVAGGLGSLHATIIHSWGATLTTTRSIEPLS
ncbi:hypothetical protein [Aeromicrobium sp. UC242_57]|uniref:hypothetical protein n=1 Tax=Aeromicrobium sp. UC242_57 TaxID=3374624 RepID=UPI00379AE22B